MKWPFNEVFANHVVCFILQSVQDHFKRFQNSFYEVSDISKISANPKSRLNMVKISKMGVRMLKDQQDDFINGKRSFRPDYDVCLNARREHSL